MWAIPFSLRGLRPTGEAFPIAQNAAFPSVSAEGTLVFLDSPDTGLDNLVWRDRSGAKLGVIGQPQPDMQFLVLAPDDRSVAVKSTESGNNDIWIHDANRPLKRRLTTDEASDNWPTWSPTGHEITYQSDRRGNLDIYRRSADGTGEVEALVATESIDRPFGWSADGRYLLYTTSDGNDSDIWFLERTSDANEFQSIEYLATRFSEHSPRLSPDGRFVAYCSSRSGETQVYVREFPSAGKLEQVSTNGGCQPRWSRDGSELFYVEGSTLKAVPVKTDPALSVGSPQTLFSDRNLRQNSADTYDISSDGRFVLLDWADSGSKPPKIQVMQNWYEEFRDREQD